MLDDEPAELDVSTDGAGAISLLARLTGLPSLSPSESERVDFIRLDWEDLTVPCGLALFDDFETLPTLVREGRAVVSAFLALVFLAECGIVAVVFSAGGVAFVCLDISGVVFSRRCLALAVYNAPAPCFEIFLWKEQVCRETQRGPNTKFIETPLGLELC